MFNVDDMSLYSSNSFFGIHIWGRLGRPALCNKEVIQTADERWPVCQQVLKW